MTFLGLAVLVLVLTAFDAGRNGGETLAVRIRDSEAVGRSLDRAVGLDSLFSYALQVLPIPMLAAVASFLNLALLFRPKNPERLPEGGDPTVVGQK